MRLYWILKFEVRLSDNMHLCDPLVCLEKIEHLVKLFLLRDGENDRDVVDLRVLCADPIKHSFYTLHIVAHIKNDVIVVYAFEAARLAYLIDTLNYFFWNAFLATVSAHDI